MLQVDENVDSVKRTPANSSEAWLLVFDNADHPNLRLASYLLAGNRCDVIITSRNPQTKIQELVNMWHSPFTTFLDGC